MHELSKEFPNVCLEAAKYVAEEAKAKWRLGGALEKDCGPPSDKGIKDGSGEKMGRCARLLAEKYGTEIFGKRYLGHLRQTAFMFPSERRHEKISWAAHRAAGHPDTLDEIVEIAEAEENVTVEFVKDYLQLSRTPRKKGSKLSKKEQSALLATMKFMARATKAIVIAEAMQELVELHLTDLSPDHVAAMIESAMSVANKWTEIVAALRQDKKQPKRSHLQVVG